MAQDEVIRFLEKKKVWIDSSEISKQMKEPKASVSKSLGKLYKAGEIFRREKTREEKNNSNWHNTYVYKIK